MKRDKAAVVPEAAAQEPVEKVKEHCLMVLAAIGEEAVMEASAASRVALEMIDSRMIMGRRAAERQQALALDRVGSIKIIAEVIRKLTEREFVEAMQEAKRLRQLAIHGGSAAEH